MRRLVKDKLTTVPRPLISDHPLF